MFTVYKNLLIVTYVMNVFVLFMGGVALFNYLETHDMTSMQMIAVASGVLIFGILLPAWIASKLIEEFQRLRKQTEQMVAEYVSKWLATFKHYDEIDPLHDPKLWVTAGLLAMEVVGEHSRHPALRALAEFSPVLRSEIRRTSQKRTSSKARDND